MYMYTVWITIVMILATLYSIERRRKTPCIWISAASPIMAFVPSPIVAHGVHGVSHGVAVPRRSGGSGWRDGRRGPRPWRRRKMRMWAIAVLLGSSGLILEGMDWVKVCLILVNTKSGWTKYGGLQLTKCPTFWFMLWSCEVIVAKVNIELNKY